MNQLTTGSISIVGRIINLGVRIKTLTALLVLLCAVTSAFAYDFEYTSGNQKLAYKILDYELKTVEVQAGKSIESPGINISGEVVVPRFAIRKRQLSSYDESGNYIGERYEEITYKVVSIGDFAFSGNTNLTMVSLPNTIKSIGDYAFYRVGEVNIPNSVTSIGRFAFSRSRISDVSIPKSIETIKQGTFSNCSYIKSLTIPVSVISIESEAFANCSYLTSLTIPESVTSIGSSAFYGCTALKNVKVNNVNKWARTIFEDEYSNPLSYAHYLYVGNSTQSITRLLIEGSDPISDFAFTGAYIRRIRIKDCPPIGNKAFWNTIINYLLFDSTELGDFAFGTDNKSQLLPSIYIDQENPITLTNQFYNRIGSTVIYVPTGCKEKYLQNTFWGQYPEKISETSMSSLDYFFEPDYENQEIEIIARTIKITPEGPVNLNIGDEMLFYAQISPASVTSKSVNWTSSNTKVATVSDSGKVTAISEGETTIVATAVDGSNKYDEITVKVLAPLSIGDTITENNFIFTVTSNTEVSVAAANNEISGDIVIPSCVKYGNDSYTVASIAESGFRACKNITALEIPNSVTSMGTAAFAQCEALSHVSIPSSIAVISASAFYGCSNLSSIILPNSTSRIEGSAFSHCTGLNSIQLPDATTYIGDFAFYECTGLKEIVIPNNVINIGDCVFKNCINLTIISIGKAVQTIGNGAFSGCTSLHFIYSYNHMPPECRFDTFYEVSEDACIFVPDDSSELYRDSEGWKYFSNYLENFDPVVFVKEIVLNKSHIELRPGEQILVNATVKPENATYTELKWESTRPEIATVTKEGYITADSIGETTIIVSAKDDSGGTARCDVTVTPIQATSVTLNQSNLSLKATESFKLIATILPETTTDKNVVWKSTDTSVATVDKSGMVIAVALGEAEVTATCGAISASCNVIVEPTPADSILIDKTKAVLKVADTLQLNATILPETTTDKRLTWKSADESVAVVDASGKVTAISVGQTHIIVIASSGASAMCEISVVLPLAESIKLDQTTVSLHVGEISSLTAIIYPEIASDNNVTWSSSDTKIVSVDDDGKITALSEGVAIITATTKDGSNLQANCTVKVSNIVVTSVGIVYSGPQTLYIGDTVQLSYIVYPENATNKEVRWSVPDAHSNILQITDDGLVTAVGTGRGYVYLRSASNHISSSIYFDVVKRPDPLESITLFSNKTTIQSGDTIQIYAIIEPYNAIETIEWISSDEEIATVTNDGIVTAQNKSGKVTISAIAENGISGNINLNVEESAPEPTELHLNITETTFHQGSFSENIKVITTPSNAKPYINWSCTGDAVISLYSYQDGSIHLSASKHGCATLIAEYGGWKEECKITVLKPAFNPEFVDYYIDGELISCDQDVDATVGEPLYVDVHYSINITNKYHDNPHVGYSSDIIEVNELSREEYEPFSSGFIVHYAITPISVGESALLIICENTAQRMWINVKKSSGLNSVLTDSNGEDPIYYDLRGNIITCKNLLPGIYIKRTGSKIEKVFIHQNQFNQ